MKQKSNAIAIATTAATETALGDTSGRPTANAAGRGAGVIGGHGLAPHAFAFHALAPRAAGRRPDAAGIGGVLLAAVLAGAALTAGGCASSKTGPTQKEAATLQWNQARAAVLFGLARDQYNNGNFDTSRKTIDDALKLDPKNPQLHMLAARISIELNQLDLAQQSLATTRELAPKDAEACYYAGIVAQRWQKWDEALADYTAASERAPTELAYLMARAEMLVLLDRNDEALSLLQEKVTFFDHSGPLRDAVGQLLMQKHDYAAAAELFRQASVLAEDDPTLRQHLALALYYGGNFRDSADLLMRLVETDDGVKDGSLFLALGECQLQLDRAQDARGSFERAAELSTGDPAAHLGVAKAALALGDLRRADLAVRKAIVLQPDSGEATLLLGYLRLRQGRNDEALGAFRRAAQLDRTDPTPLCMIGYTLSKSGKNDQAMEFYGRALKLKPDDRFASELMASIEGE